MSGFEYIAHTADVGVRAFGKTRAEAFENAALGMFSLICDVSRVRGTERVNLELEYSGDMDGLIVDWLNELLYLYESREMLFSSFHIDKIAGGKLRGWASGEKLDRGRHRFGEDIKAATYHTLSIKQLKEGWSAQVIFDV